jgi:hypothetical protein
MTIDPIACLICHASVGHRRGTSIGWRKRWPLLLVGVLALLLVGYVTRGLLHSGTVAYDPEILGALRPGMTRQEVETALGQPLVPQMDRRGIMVRSSRPVRSLTPGLLEEEGLDLYFDDQGILREPKGWVFVRPESLAERICHRLGI